MIADMLWRVLCVFLVLAPAARACETALLLSMDVSNSVDVAEYRLQIDGLAAALTDPEIAEILVRDRVTLSVMQWSGVTNQTISLPWTQMQSPAHVAAFAGAVRGLERAYVLSDTAPAEALRFALRQFRDVPGCKRHVLDVSGDGTPNAGSDVRGLNRLAEQSGITVNGLAIESMGLTITNFYRRSIITRDGFVITAQGHRDYARAIRIKILREISRVLG